MAEAGENFAAFNSRALVEMVGGVTDEALKATRIKKFLSVLAGRYFNWAGKHQRILPILRRSMFEHDNGQALPKIASSLQMEK